MANISGLMGSLFLLTSLSCLAFDGIKERAEVLTRDASWASRIEFQADAFYELMPQLYKDKVSVCEIFPTYKNSIINLFCCLIDRHWNLDVNKCRIFQFDALDALTMAALSGNPAIAQEAIRMLPLTKAVPQDGKTSTFKSKDLVIDTKINIDQAIWQAYDFMSWRINKGRMLKIATVPAGIAAYFGLTTSKFFDGVLAGLDPIGVDSKEITAAVNTTVGSAEVKGLTAVCSYAKTGIRALVKWSPEIILAVTAILTHRLQCMYTEGYVKIFETILTSNKVTFDHARTKMYLFELSNKLNAFGFGASYARRLQKLAVQL